MINENSRKIYLEQVKPTIKERHKLIMAALFVLGDATVYDIGDYIRKEVHTFSGRLSELSGTKEYDKPLIEAVGIKKNKYNNPCTLWRIKLPKEIPLEQSSLMF